MRLGVMTRVFERDSVEEVAEAIAAAGLSAVQLSLESGGLEGLPASFDPAVCRRIREAFQSRDIEISAVSGTFNAIDPDRESRAECIRRVGALAAACEDLGTRVITQCTGTRNAASMWRYHPDNARPEAWEEMVDTFSQLVPVAERHGVVLAFEPEVVNVVDTAAKARRLIDQIGSESLRIVMDPANYFHPDMLPRMTEVLEDGFAQTGHLIALAHAKDVRLADGDAEECVRPAAGTGVLDYATYIRLLRESGYDGGLIMHSLGEAEVAESAVYVRRFLDA